MDPYQMHDQYPVTRMSSDQIDNGTAAMFLDTHHQVAESSRAQSLKQKLQHFWDDQMKQIQEAPDLKSLKKCNLPHSRVKRIMKSDPDTNMVSGEAPALFAKACELFIVDLTLHSWQNTEDDKRPMLRRSDIAKAVRETELFDFLDEVLFPNEHRVNAPTNNPEQNTVDPIVEGCLPMINNINCTFTTGNPPPQMMTPTYPMPRHEFIPNPSGMMPDEERMD